MGDRKGLTFVLDSMTPVTVACGKQQHKSEAAAGMHMLTQHTLESCICAGCVEKHN